MQILSAIINNQWVITVLGGLLITLISTISSYIWTSRVSQKNLKKCQEEILSILEKVLTNDTELTEELLQSIVNSLIRKNNISVKRFFSNSELIEDVLVRLYMIDYIPIVEKNELIRKLLTLRCNLNISGEEESRELENVDVSSTRKNMRLRTFLVMYCIVLLWLIILFYAFREIRGILFFGDKFLMIQMLIAVLLTVVIFTYLLILMRTMKFRERGE